MINMSDVKNLILKWRKFFNFKGKKYSYFINKYNKTWRNERCVEIPIVKEFLKNPYEKTLEVGNVTKNYYKNDYIVIDKYEEGPGVTNVDIIDYEPFERYDKIIAISTLEHVGEDVKDPSLAIDAIEHLKTLLAPNGKMLITIPAGFNEPLERHIFELGLDVNGLIEENGLWYDCDPKLLNGKDYNSKNHTATGLYVCFFEKRS